MHRGIAFLAIIAWSATAHAEERPPCITEDEVLDAAQEHFPTRYDTLVDLQVAGSERYFRMLRNTAHQLENPDMVRAFEQLDRASARLDRLGAVWAEATPAERAAMEPELVAAADAAVQAELTVKKIRQEQLRASLDEINRELRDLDQNRDLHVAEAVERATR